MDPVRNPYSPGAGLRPPELAGRDKEVSDFLVVRRRAASALSNRSVVMTGLRGVGKTVLLNELAQAAAIDGWIIAKVEADHAAGNGAFREQVSIALNRSLREATGSFGMMERFKRALATFRSFTLGVDPSGRFSIGIDIDPAAGRADTGSLETDLTDLALDLAAAARERSVGVGLFIDELQDLGADEKRAVCQACHTAGQEELPFYVIGAGLPSLPGALADARSYAERLFAYWSIDALDSDSASEALVRPAVAAGVAWNDDAVEMVISESAGYPYFLQEFGKASWDFAPGPEINLDDAVAGVEAGILSLDRGFYTSRWERATPSERDYMRAMAVDGSEPSSSGAVARRLSKRASSVGPTRAGLIHKGLIFAPEHGLIAFTVPGMADFIKRLPN